MKFKNTFSRSSTLLLYFLFLFAVISCTEEDNYSDDLPTVSYVNFASATDTIAEGGSVQVNLEFSKPLEVEGTIAVNFMADSLSTAQISDFTTSPAIDEQIGSFVLTLEKGATETSFTVNPKDNELLNEEKIIAFKLSDATLGLRLAETDLYKIITVPDDEVKQGDLTVSMEELADFGEVRTGEFSASQTYTASGAGLTSDLKVVSSENFEVSLDTILFSKELTIPVADVNAAPVEVYVRFAPKTELAQTLSGTISNTALGTYAKEVQVMGTEAAAKEPPVLFFRDNFEYGSASGDLKDLSDWENYQGDGVNIQYYPDALTYENYPEEGGGTFELVNGSGSREDVKRDIPATSSGVIYTSQLVKISIAGSGTFFQSLRNAGGTYFNRLYIKGGDDGYNLGIARTKTGGGSESYSDKTITYDKTVIVVTKYDFDTKVSSLFIIDGDIPAEEPTTADASANSGKEPDTLVDINYRQAGGDMTARIGGIRIGPSWNDVLAL